MTWAHLIFFALYVGLALVMVQAWWKRRSAINAWRKAAGGSFDRSQRKFVTELDLDRAKLPPEAQAMLSASRKGMLWALAAMASLLALQLVLMGL